MRQLKSLSWNEFISQFDSSVHSTIVNIRKKPGVFGVVCLKCEVFDSSRFGLLTALIYGESCTYKSIESLNEHLGGIYTTGLPSSASFPINYTTEIPK